MIPRGAWSRSSGRGRHNHPTATPITVYLICCSTHHGANNTDPTTRSWGCIASRVLYAVGDDEGAGCGCGAYGHHSTHPKGAQLASEVPINIVSGSGPGVTVLDACIHGGFWVSSEGCDTHHLMPSAASQGFRCNGAQTSFNSHQV